MKSPMVKKGFALPSVIFLMVVVALIIAFMSRLLVTQSAINNLGLLGTKAHWAAYSANEWVTYQINRTATCPTAPSNFVIEGFQISFTCTTTAYLEDSTSATGGTLFDIRVTAQHGTDQSSPDYVSRTLERVLDVQ